MAVNAETTAVTKSDSLGRRAPCRCSVRLASVCSASRHTLGLDDDRARARPVVRSCSSSRRWWERTRVPLTRARPLPHQLEPQGASPSAAAWSRR